jgi:gliding motility-associated-like protein
VPNHFQNIILCLLLFFCCETVTAQFCPKDSNFYSITYKGTQSNSIADAIINNENEIVSLGYYNPFGSFVSKYSSQGANIWSNEYNANYPHESWVQFPYYERTSMQGITSSSNGTFYVYGSSYEHGKSVNNVEEPAAHWVGILLHIDKFGKIITSKYFGNWGTNYKVGNVIELANGNLIIYLASSSKPEISKVICVNEKGELLWATPLQTLEVYEDVNPSKNVMCQLKNGNIAIARLMVRNLDDTLQYPFNPPIILPAPLNYFHLFELDGKTGNLKWETSYQCPTLTNTNISNSYAPTLKYITELKGGNISILADMYLPLDSERFYKNRIYSRRAVNFVTDPDGFLKKFTAYRPPNSSGSLESVKKTGVDGELLLLMKDSADAALHLFKINEDGDITWNKAYKNSMASNSSQAVGLPKQNSKGYFILQSDDNTFDFHANITDVAGENGCLQSSGNIIAEKVLWPWLTEKVHLFSNIINIDFRYSSFNMKTEVYPLSQNTDCQYQYECCKDFVDSLHPKAISLCPGETYTLPDNTIIKDSGTYYGILKTQKGCDSILFYNVKLLKIPADLKTSPDTCLKNAASIELRATEGYTDYLWNNIALKSYAYPVTTPGVYTVKVQNKCGTKTDTISVYADCNFTIYFPNAFTPNNDYLNDVLKVPRHNKNKLIRLTLYNRFGHLVFKTTKLDACWDGTFKGEPQPAGVYTYFLEMESLEGKKTNQKGTVVLIR